MKVYADRIRAGGFKVNVQPQILREQESSALLDAGDVMRQVAAMSAMKLAIAKAKKTGLAVVSVRNANHFGASPFYAVCGLGDVMVCVAAPNACLTMAQ